MNECMYVCMCVCVCVYLCVYADVDLYVYILRIGYGDDSDVVLCSVVLYCFVTKV